MEREIIVKSHANYIVNDDLADINNLQVSRSQLFAITVKIQVRGDKG